MNIRQSYRALPRGMWRGVAAVVAVFAIAGCDQLLDVEVPGNLTEDDLLQPESANILVASVIGDFECSHSMMSAAASGFEDTTWRTSGYWTAEPTYNGGQPGGGSCTSNSDTGTSYFAGFQKSRYLGEIAYEKLANEWTDEQVANRDVLAATAAAYVGMHYTVFGERYCEYSPGVGPMLTPSETLRVAEQWFQRALDQLGGGDAEIVSTTSLAKFIYLARARVRLSLGDHAGAKADAERVADDPEFVVWITRDSSVRGRWNAVHRAINISRYRTVGGPMYWNEYQDDVLVSAGYRDLTISEVDGRHTVADGVPDPRVPSRFTGEFSTDGITDQWTQDKYTSVGDPQAMGKWAEAKLILAEIAMGQEAVDHINDIRDRNNLPHLVTNDDDEIYRAIIEERRREFFFEGRFHADKLRYGLWFPRGLGQDHKRNVFGFAYCLLMPNTEYELNQNIIEEFGPDYEGPNLQDTSIEFELKLDREVEWPVPSEL